jgi:hypothetical protein
MVLYWVGIFVALFVRKQGIHGAEKAGSQVLQLAAPDGRSVVIIQHCTVSGKRLSDFSGELGGRAIPPMHCCSQKHETRIDQ